MLGATGVLSTVPVCFRVHSAVRDPEGPQGQGGLQACSRSTGVQKSGRNEATTALDSPMHAVSARNRT